MRTLAERGLRASWLRQHLIGRHALTLLPKDRDVLTLVALEGGPVERRVLNDQLRAMGHPDPDPLVGRVVTGGFLTGRLLDGDQVIDLPDEDTCWIRTQLGAVSGC